MVKDWIITTCLESMLAAKPNAGDKGKGAAAQSSVPEDNIEAACEVLSTAGAKVAKSDNDKLKRKLEDVFRQLGALEKDKHLSSRIRFVIKDIIDLRKGNWVPRRETFTAKKLDEVRAQAEAELGMISTSVLTGEWCERSAREGDETLIDAIELILLSLICARLLFPHSCPACSPCSATDGPCRGLCSYTSIEECCRCMGVPIWSGTKVWEQAECTTRRLPPPPVDCPACCLYHQV